MNAQKGNVVTATLYVGRIVAIFMVIGTVFLIMCYVLMYSSVELAHHQIGKWMGK
jgi:hypothetical protein